MPLLEDLMTSPDAAPTAEYRILLRQAVESGVTVDQCAEQLAALASRLGLTAIQVRADFDLMRRAIQLEGRFDVAELAADQVELEKARVPEDEYHRTGGTLAQSLLRLTRERDALKGGDRAAVLGEIEEVQERGMKLTRVRRTVEDKVISALAARDRAAAFKQSHTRLFPRDGD